MGYTKHRYMCILKYSFSLIIIIISFFKFGNRGNLVIQTLELGIIILISDCLFKKKIVAYLINSFLLLLLNLQLIVTLFSSSYISYMMISSLHNYKALAGHSYLYIASIVLVILVSWFPICELNRSFSQRAIICLLIMELVLTMYKGNAYSPLYGCIRICSDYKEVNDNKKRMRELNADIEEFYNSDVPDMRAKNDSLPDNPNIVLIFTEGLSQNIVEDEREIMPNVAKYESLGMSFDNYYNHTFATYRGLIGQLYSGYCFEDFSENHLVSLQSILHDNGYYTEFINTEPNNYEFMCYLQKFEFDTLLSDTKVVSNGLNDSISDKDAYDLLWDQMEELDSNNNPYLLSIYTFGTHASFDSPDEMFLDGNDPLLNKFYNLDCQFGQFMEKFEESEYSDDTIIIFTADHSTYSDSDFANSFPEYNRDFSELDRIPLVIYYKGIEPEKIDADGKNSLTLTPTILDLLDISGENYFLGNSVFANKWQKSDYDTIFIEGNNYYNTSGGVVSPLTENESQLLSDRLLRYYEVSQGER